MLRTVKSVTRQRDPRFVPGLWLYRVRFKVMQSMLSNQKWMGAQRMTTAKLSDEALLAILTAHPELRDRFASIARAVEDSDGDLKEADAVEERIVQELRVFGRAAMEGWAEHQV